MTSKSLVEVVEPLFLNRMDNQLPEDPEATETEEEDTRHYRSERFFPFPAKRIVQDDRCRAFGQNVLTSSGPLVSISLRRKNVISRWGYKDQKQGTVTIGQHTVTSGITESAGNVCGSGKRGGVSVTRSEQRSVRRWNNPDAPWRSGT